jgi:hypothetical protein
VVVECEMNSLVYTRCTMKYTFPLKKSEPHDAHMP